MALPMPGPESAGAGMFASGVRGAADATHLPRTTLLRSPRTARSAVPTAAVQRAPLTTPHPYSPTAAP